MTTTIQDQLRAGAKGIYADEAAVELLIRAGLTYERAPWVTTYGGYAAIDAHRLVDESAGLSGGAQRIIRLSASLLGGDPVNLAEALAGLDRHHSELVAAAIAHAMGSHEHSGLLINDDGTGTIVALPSIYPWPDAEAAS